MKIKELLTDKSKWTKGACGRDKYGVPVYRVSDEAVCWCLVGALEKCYKEEEVDKINYLIMIDKIYEKIGREN